MFTLLCNIFFMFFIIYSNVLISAIPLTKTDDSNELQQVQVLFRHGQRTPYWIYEVIFIYLNF